MLIKAISGMSDMMSGHLHSVRMRGNVYTL